MSTKYCLISNYVMSSQLFKHRRSMLRI